MKSVKLILIVLFSIVTIGFFLIPLWYSLYIWRVNGVEKEMEHDSHSYKYFEVDIKNNRTSLGFVSIFQELQEDEYFSYKESAGHYVLISPIGLDEYSCSGRCSCETSDRRNAATYVSRGSLYLVAAISSVLALQKAKDKFQDVCEEEFSDECSPSFVSSEVDSCEKIGEQEYDTGNGMSDIRSFFCQGRCLPSNRIKFHHNLDTDIVRLHKVNIDCEKMWHETEMKADCTGLSREEIFRLIHMKFQNEHLVKFCSQVFFEVVTDEEVVYSFGDHGHETKRVTMCVASYDGELNKYVNCRQTSERGYEDLHNLPKGVLETGVPKIQRR